MKVLPIADLHLPWTKMECVKEIFTFARRYKPDVIIQLGDLYDQYMFGRYTHDLNLIHPKDEIETAHDMATEFWCRLRKACPDAKLVQLFGNHDMRFAKGIMDNYPALAHEINSLRQKYYKFDDVTVYSSDRDYVEYDGVVYCHGWMSGCGKHMRHFNQPVVHAHTHHPDIVYVPLSKSDYKPLWEMDCGWLGDEKQVPFNYTNSTRTNWGGAICAVTHALPELIKL